MRRPSRLLGAVLIFFAASSTAASAADPIAVVDGATTFENLAVTIVVLANDTDADGDTLSVTSATAGANGTTLVNGDQTITYTPSAGFTGVDSFTYTASDGGDTDVGTVSVTVWPDGVPPTIAASLSTPANAHGWHDAPVTVTFTCTDLESGVSSCSDPVVVDAEGVSAIVGNASDAAGNTADANVTVRIDTGAPTIGVDAPSSGRRGGRVTITATPDDADSGVDYVRFTVDGAPAPDVTVAPFTHVLDVPDTALPASTLTVDVLVSDRAGNTATTSAHITVLTDGFVIGEVYDASRGIPLAGASIDYGSGTTTTDVHGRYGFASDASSATVLIEKTGYTSAERVVDIDTVHGTRVLDARLTPEDPTSASIDSAGGSTSDAAGVFELTVPAGALAGATEVRVTSIASHALRAPLPLGWSPLGSASVGPDGASFPVAADLTLMRDASGLAVDVVRYDISASAWRVEALGLTGGAEVTASIDSTGDYAFIIADTGDTAPPAATAGQLLLGTEPVEVAFGLSATSDVHPSAVPVGAGAIAEGEVVLSAPIALPSGTLIAARVEEIYEPSPGGAQGELRSEPFTQELPLHRYPMRADRALHGKFPVTPTHELALTDVLEGVLHVDVDVSAASAHGSLIGSEGGIVSGTGDASISIEAGALTETIAVDIRAVDPDTFELAFDGLTLLGGIDVDLSGATLSASATASIDVGTLPGPDPIFAARYVTVSGTRRLALMGAAIVAGTEVGTGGVDTDGTFLFFQSDVPLALVGGVISEIGGGPADSALVESSTTPFIDVTAADGTYLVAAKLVETTLTARSLLNRNVGAATVTPPSASPLVVDFALTATGPYVTSMKPADGALGVATAPAITAEFSEPVNPASVTTASFELRLTGGAAVPGRIILGAGNLSASFLPASNLDPVTSYEVALSAAVTDGDGNPLLPLTVSFTTLDTSVASYDPDEVKVTFPDADGNVTVTAPAGVFEPNAFVTIQNVTKGIVITGDVDNDGSFSFVTQAAITDELQIRILSSGDRELVIEKTEYIAEDGSVAIGTKGGKISEGEFTLDVPEGAISSAAIFQLAEVAAEVIDALPMAGGAAGKGAAVEVVINGDLEKEADLSFPIPAGAPPPEDADFAIVRVLEFDGVTVYETVDSATVQDGKVTTDSFPFPGVLEAGMLQVVWLQRAATGGKSPMGAITGIVQETDGSPTAPVTRPLEGVRVAIEQVGGLGDGDHVTKTNAEGRFTLFDADFGATGGQVPLVATDASGRVAYATASENAGVVATFPNLSRYNKAGDVVINFPLADEPAPPTSVTIKLFRMNEDGEEEQVADGIVEVGAPLHLVLEFSQPPVSANAWVDTLPLVLTPDGERRFRAEYLPDRARSYEIEVIYADAHAANLTASKNFLGAAAGADNTVALEGPPAILSDASWPRDGAKQVALDDTFLFQFTEPVTGVSSSTVKLFEGGSEIELDLIGTGPDGAKLAETADVIHTLTATPRDGLEFATSYLFQFDGAIVDTGTDASPLNLEPSPTTIGFETFASADVADLGIETEEFSLAPIGDVLFVANRRPADDRFGTLETVDLRVPTDIKRIPERDSEFVGVWIHRAAAEADVSVNGETRDVVAVLAFETFSGNTGLTLFDVDGARQAASGAAAPYPYLGFVTTTLPSQGYGADLALQDGWAYVASGKAGLQIVNLDIANALFLDEAPWPLSTIPASVRTRLYSRGQGFGQPAILAAASFPNQDVVSVAVGNTSLGRTGFVGLRNSAVSQSSLGIVNLSTPFAPAPVTTIELRIDANELGWPNRIALTRASGKELAVVVGGTGKMAVVDVTDPLLPVVESIVSLEGNWGASVTAAETGTVYVGTPQGLEAYSLADPAAPKLVGTFPNLVSGSGDAAVTNGLVIAGGKTSGLKVVAVDVKPSIATTELIVVDNDYRSVDSLADFVAVVTPPDYEFRAIDLILIEEDLPIGSPPLTPSPGADNVYVSNVTKGLQLPRPPPPPPPPPEPPPPPKPNGAQLILDHGLPEEKSRLLDLNHPGARLVVPLLEVFAGRKIDPSFADPDVPASELPDGDVATLKRVAQQSLQGDGERNDNGEPVLSVGYEVDVVNGTACLSSYDWLFFAVGRTSTVKVTLEVDGAEHVVMEGVRDPASSPASNRWFALPSGDDDADAAFLSLLPIVDGTHRLKVTAKLLSDPSVEVERFVEVKVHAKQRNVLPVGQTFVKGVALLDGHLVASSTDANIPGRGPGLRVTRTYGSAGNFDGGHFGAGWNLNFHSRLIVSSCFWTIVGGDGSGQRFTQVGDQFVPQKGYHTSLRRNDDGSYDFFTKGRIRYHYVGLPRVSEDPLFGDRPNLDFIEDTNGNRLKLTYDADYNITEVQEIFADDTTGRSLFFDYEIVRSEPRVSRITGPMGLEILYAYDEWGNLTKVTRDARIETYEYSVTDHRDRHNLVAYIDPNGHRTEYVYYADTDTFPGEGGELVLPLSPYKHEWIREVREGAGTPDEAVTTFAYDLTEVNDGVFKSSVSDARGNLTAYVLNKDGSPLEIVEPGDVVTTMEWADNDITKLSETNALGRTTLFEYDDNANLKKETIEAGGAIGDVITEFEYDPTFNKMTLKRVHNVAPSGASVQDTHFKIDSSNGNLIRTTDAENNVTEFSYLANGDLQYVEGPRPGQLSTFAYDPYGNPITSIDAEGNSTTSVYDERSRLVESSDTFGRSTIQIYDALDRVVSVTRDDFTGSSDPQTVTRTYYPGGQVQTETNGLGLVTTFILDALNRVRSTSDSLGDSTARTYDGNGNVLTATDRRGVVTTNTYDALNRITRVDVSGPFGDAQTVSTMDYDELGNKLWETDLHGSRTDFDYDALYRVTARRLPTDPVNHVERFTYDTAGNALTQSNANGKFSTFVYDLLNRAIRQTDAVGNVTEISFDEGGNPVETRDVTRGLTTETDYDFLNRPIEQRVTGAEPDGFTYTTSFVYDDPAHTVTQTDPRGYSTLTVLDAFDRVHRVEQDTGDEALVTTTYYDANGNVRQTRDPEGRETDFTYDARSRLTRVDFPLGLSTTYDYDGEGNKLEEVDRRGIATRFDYDNLGRVTRTELDESITGGGAITTSTVTYDDALRERVELDARGNPTTFEMDEQGRVTKLTDALTHEQTFTYDGVNKLSEVDERGLATTFHYDDINRLTKVTNALAQAVTTVYDDDARTVTETDRRNIVKTTQLDALGRLLSVTRAGVTLEQHQYDGNNNRTVSTDANSNATAFTYDGANRLIARTDAAGTPIATTTTFTYDRAGNLLEEKDGRPTGVAYDVRNSYDELNRLIAVEDALGNTTTFEYDGEGNRTALVEPKSTAHRTEYAYGELGELIQVTMADGGVYTYEYDDNRNRTSQTDANGNVVEFTYDPLNRVDVMTQDPGGFDYTTLHAYDDNGNETQLTDPKGQVIDFEYDNLNRLEKKIYHLTADDLLLLTRTHQIDYHYDPNDNLIQIDEWKSSGSDPPAIVSSFKSYDSLDRLESETDAWAKTLSYGYDNQGNRTSLTDPDSVRTEYAFDELNRLDTLTLEAGTPAAQAVTYEYFANGLKKSVDNPNATASTYSYDAASRMTSITHTGPTGVVSAYGYSYGPNGNRTQQIEQNAGRTETTLYDYDLTNRLKTVTYEAGLPTAHQVSYTYDPVGNRLTEQVVQLEGSILTKSLTYAYDPINRLDSIDDLLGTDDVAYEYDPNGNTLTKTKVGVTTEFKYDIRNQLSEVQQGPSVLGRYGYDNEGLRILKIGDDGLRRYTYDQLSVITEANTSNVTVSKYDYGFDQLVSLDNTSEGRSFFHLDFLGSTANLTDGIGATTQSILYDAWGNERERVGTSANKFTFTGHEKDDETGLIYAKARFYDADTGRFLNQDPLLGSVASPPSLHRYTYVFSNPFRYVDPDGRQATIKVGREDGTIEEVPLVGDSTTVTAEAPDFFGRRKSWKRKTSKHTGVVEESSHGDTATGGDVAKELGKIFGGPTAEPPKFIEDALDTGAGYIHGAVIVFPIKTAQGVVGLAVGLGKLMWLDARMKFGSDEERVAASREMQKITQGVADYLSESGGYFVRGVQEPGAVVDAIVELGPTRTGSMLGETSVEVVLLADGSIKLVNRLRAPKHQVQINKVVGDEWDNFVGERKLGGLDDLEQLGRQEKLPTPDLRQSSVNPDYTIYNSRGGVAAYADAKTGARIPFDDQARGLVGWSEMAESRKLIYYVPSESTVIPQSLVDYAANFGVDILKIVVQ